jgi:hypothetical protein
MFSVQYSSVLYLSNECGGLGGFWFVNFTPNGVVGYCRHGNGIIEYFFQSYSSSRGSGSAFKVIPLHIRVAMPTSILHSSTCVWKWSKRQGKNQVKEYKERHDVVFTQIYQII